MIDLGTAMAILDLNADGFKKGLSTAASQLQAFADKSNSLSGRISALGNAATTVGKKLTLGVSTPLAGAATVAAKFGMDFEQGLKKVETIADTSVKSMDELGSGVIDVSKKVNISTSELNEALYQVISANGDTANSLSYVEQASKLAKGGFTDVTVAIDGVTSVMNAYGMQGAEAFQKVSDVMITTQNLGKTTVDELARSISQVIPTAAAMGVSFEQVSAALATMTAQGTQTSVAVTQLNQMLAELGKSGTEVDQVLRRATSTTKTYSAAEIAAAQSSNAAALKSKQKYFNDVYKERQKAFSKEEKAFKKQLDNEMKELKNVYEEREKLAKEEYDTKMKQLNDEYMANLKILDEERYNQIKAIDDEINGINAKTKAEDKALEARDNQRRLSELQDRVDQAETAKEREEAEQDLADFKAELRRKAILEQREQRIEELKGQKDAINEQYDEKVAKLEEEKKVKEEQYTEEYNTLKENLSNEKELEIENLQEVQSSKLENLQEAHQTQLENIQEAQQAELDAISAAGAARVQAMQDAKPDGKGFQDLLDEGYSLQEILQIIQDEADKSGVSILDMFSSIDAGKAALQILSGDGEKFKNSLDGMNNSMGATDKAFEIMSSTSQESFNEMTNNLKLAATEIGMTLLPELNKLLEGIAGLIEKFTGLSDGTKKFIVTVGGILIAIGPVLSIFGKTCGIISTLITVFGKAKAAFATFNLVVGWITGGASAGAVALGALKAAFTFLTGPIGIAIVAITAAIAIIKHLWTTNEEFRNKVLEIWEAIKQGVTDAIEGIKTFFTETIPSIVDSVANWFGEMKDKAVAKVNEILDNIKQFGTNFWRWITEDLPAMIDGVVNWFAELPGRIWAWFCEVCNKANEWREDMIEKAEEIGSKFLEKIIDFFKQLPGKVKNKFQEVIDYLKGLKDKFFELGGNIISGLWDGMSGWFEKITTGIGKFFGGIVDKAKDVFDINSPSKVFADIGKNVLLGFDEGFMDEIDKVKKSVNVNMSNIIEDTKSINKNHSEASGNGTNTTNNSTIINQYNTVRNDSDIKQISKQLNAQSTRKNRSRGGLQWQQI